MVQPCAPAYLPLPGRSTPHPPETESWGPRARLHPSLAGVQVSGAGRSEAVSAYPNTLVWTREIAEQRGEPESLNVNFTEVLERDCGYKLVETAGGGHMAHLEQFDDATNVFMVKQDTAVAYDRNRQTNRVLNEHGINVVEFAGSDLVMGRGGPRCMTMPLNRD